MFLVVRMWGIWNGIDEWLGDEVGYRFGELDERSELFWEVEWEEIGCFVFKFFGGRLVGSCRWLLSMYIVYVIWFLFMDMVRYMSFYVDKWFLFLFVFLGGFSLCLWLCELLLLWFGCGWCGVRELCLVGLLGFGLCMREWREV